MNHVARVHAPAEPEVRFVKPETVEDSRVLCEPLRHLHTSALVLWCQFVTNSPPPVWMEAQVFEQDRVQ